MHLGRELITGSDWCALADEWTVATETMHRVWLSASDFVSETGRDVWIISGFRTLAQQEALRRAGRPTALDAASTHRSCPATGVDISLGTFPSRDLIETWGRIVRLNGLRWGGGSKLDDFGVPEDWQHVDRGPRDFEA